MKPVIQTYLGNYFDFEHPEDSKIDICDIAWSLSHLNRYNGHSMVPYNVAQHSVHVSRLVKPENALYGLLHDAQEAYVGDMSAPLKTLFPEYRDLEDRIQALVYKKFGLDDQLRLTTAIDVSLADRCAGMTEKRDLMRNTIEDPDYWDFSVTPDPEIITPMDATRSFALFLGRFWELADDLG